MTPRQQHTITLQGVSGQHAVKNSGKAKEILKTFLNSYINPIKYVFSFMIANGYNDGQIQCETFTWLFSNQYFQDFLTFVHDF